MSDCDKTKSLLADYSVGGLSGRVRGRVDAHLAGCPTCRAELAALARTGELLQSVGLETAPDMWESIRRRIETKSARPVASGHRWAWAGAVGVFSVLLVVVGGILMRSPSRVVAPPTITTAQQTPSGQEVTPPPETSPDAVVTAVKQVDDEMRATMEDHLSAVWATPLADEAAVGLRLLSLEGEG